MAGSAYGLRVWAPLSTVYVVWGSTYLAIKWGDASLPPFPMLSIRFLVAGALLLAWCSRHGLPRTTRRQWAAAAVIGAMLPGIGNGGVAWAETRIDSGLAALIIAIVPLWMAVFERILHGRRLSARGSVGIVVGLAGVAFLVDPGGSGESWAGLLLVGSSACWAAGSIYATRAPRPERALVGVAMQMLTGGVVLAAMGAGQWSRVHPDGVSGKSFGGVLYLIAIGSLVGYSAYSWLLQHAPPALVATYAYVNPVVAVALGALLDHEAITARTLAGGAVIVLAVALIVTSRPRREPVAPEPALPVREPA